ncbi:uncharacterized protein [Parasteatoda tepidariorum]|uniref:uncharacterized protein n=1 Tax=Parasteatoda tepidariorum TaxID=114398 RepID=UPI00077F9AB6|nr:uncharacterized protein LOC107448007 [Parasteatoda tepidariorum]
MKSLCLILAIALLSFAAANDHKEIWQNALCKLDEELLDGTEKCFVLEAEEIQTAAKECMTTLSPSSSDDIKQFTKEACEDRAIFDKLEECIDGKGFKDDKENKPDEAITCYQELFKKHGLTEMEDLFMRK